MQGLFKNSFQSQEEKDSQLIYAVKSGDIDKVNDLLINGADVAAKDNSGLTALMLAVAYCYKDITDIIISKFPATVEAKANDGWTALMWAIVCGYKHTDDIISKFPATPEAKANNGNTTLMLAAEYENKDIAQYLINLGADLAGADLLKVELSHINTQNQIQLMFAYANEKLDKARDLNKPFSKSLDEKISQIRIEANRISSSEIPVDEKRIALGKINRQLLKLGSLNIRPEELQEEKLRAECIRDNASIPMFDLDLANIIIELAGSQRAQVEGILSDILVSPIVPTTDTSMPSATRIYTTLEAAAALLAGSPSITIPSI